MLTRVTLRERRMIVSMTSSRGALMRAREELYKTPTLNITKSLVFLLNDIVSLES